MNINIFNNSQFLYTASLFFFIYYGNIIYIKHSLVINREVFNLVCYLYDLILVLQDEFFYYGEYDENDKNDENDENDKNDKNDKYDETKTLLAIEDKYEDKYLLEIKKLNSEFVFLEEEKELELEKTNEIFNKLKLNYSVKTDDFEYNVIMEQAKDQARQFVIEKRLEKIKDCFVMEKTPLGNVLMTYNISKGSFQFYSDNTIPYRYLETVSRKFVKLFDCRPIYYDMEEELKNYETKLEVQDVKEKEEIELKLMKENVLNEKNEKKEDKQKKNVFAKFKSYNKESGTGHVNTGAPPKNSIPSKVITESSTNAKILLKENANRYTYEGKLSNFNMLKKVDKKLVDKKLGLSFSDFKKKQMETKNDNLFL